YDVQVRQGFQSACTGRLGVDVVFVRSGPYVHHDAGVGEPGQLFSRGDPVVQIADLVHQTQLHGLRPCEDTPVRDELELVSRQGLPAFGDHLEKARLEPVDHALEDRTLLLAHGTERRANVLLRTGFDRARLHADLLEQALRVDAQHDDPHAAGHARRVGDDPIGGDGDVVPSGGADVHDDGHDGNFAF